MSLNDDQIDALVDGNPVDELEDESIPETSVGEVSVDEQKTAMQKALSLPFTHDAIADFAITRFAERKQAFIENSERQIREAAAYGACEVTLGTLGAKNYHDAVQKHCEDAGFIVESNFSDKEKTSLVIKLYGE